MSQVGGLMTPISQSENYVSQLHYALLDFIPLSQDLAVNRVLKNKNKRDLANYLDNSKNKKNT